MIHTTDQLLHVLAELLEARSAAAEAVMRLAGDGLHGYRLAVDQPGPDDQVVAHDGRPLVVISDTLSDELHGAVLDVTHGPDALEFGIHMPVAGGAPQWVVVETPEE